MKAFLITPGQQRIEAVEVDNPDDIAALIGFDTIESDEISQSGSDRLYFDEECFIRGDAVSGRFQLDTLVPVAGKGVVVGTAGDGLKDATIDADALGTCRIMDESTAKMGERSKYPRFFVT